MINGDKVFNYFHTVFTFFGIVSAVLIANYIYFNIKSGEQRNLTPAELRAEIKCNKE